MYRIYVNSLHLKPRNFFSFPCICSNYYLLFDPINQPGSSHAIFLPSFRFKFHFLCFRWYIRSFFSCKISGVLGKIHAYNRSIVTGTLSCPKCPVHVIKFSQFKPDFAVKNCVTVYGILLHCSVSSLALLIFHWHMTEPREKNPQSYDFKNDMLKWETVRYGQNYRSYQMEWNKTKQKMKKITKKQWKKIGHGYSESGQFESSIR